MHVDLTGRRALVTAGCAGIGRAIVEQFLASGAAVAVCDVSPEALAVFRADHPNLVAVQADVSVEGDVDILFEEVVDHLGGLDILVNNAGISGPTKPIDEIAVDEWDRTLDVNLRGAFLCTRRAAPLLKEQRSGAIINISSSAGRLGMPLRAPYSSSKYAIRGLTDTLAIELGDYGVRVNAILPGFVAGPRGERVISEQAESRGMAYHDYLPLFLHNISMHVAVEDVDIAAMATFLASDHARYISGQSIGVCANFESYRAPAAQTL